MKNWNVSGTKDGEQFMIFDDSDWGADVVNGVGIDSISHINLTNEEKDVMYFVRKGVISVGEQAIKLGINYGGYLHILQDECVFTVKDISPMKTAMYSYNTKSSEDLGMHLRVVYEVTHIVDKVTKKKVQLQESILKEYLFYLDVYGYLTVC